MYTMIKGAFYQPFFADAVDKDQIAEKEKILHINTGFLINLYKRSDFFINDQTY
jgi:hypothetical protein